jgi:Xaa-Pro aminopeptidase
MRAPNDYWPHFSEEEYASRAAKVRAFMRKRGLDCLAIYGTHYTPFTDPGHVNVTWLAAYAPLCQSYIVFPQEGEPTLFIIFAPWHLPNAKEISTIQDVRGGFDIATGVAGQLEKVAGKQGRIGIVGTMHWINVSIPQAHFDLFQQRMPEAIFEVVTGAYEDLRLCKSNEEIALMERSAEVCDAAHIELNAAARSGVTDADLLRVALKAVHKRGGRINMCHIQSTSTLNPSMNYAFPLAVNRPLQTGDIILTELCAGIHGYFCKIWGAVFLGEPAPEYRRMFELAIEAYKETLAAIRPEVRGSELKEPLAGKIGAAGYDGGSAVGGWGNYNQPPGIRYRGDEFLDSEFIFQAGQTFTVHGWPISKDKRKGVWIGDTCVATKNGARSLHQNYPLEEMQVV